MTINQEIKFDDALLQLEEMIKKLEAGNLPLETAIGIYKEAMTLTEICHNKLQKIEADVVKLVDATGNISEFSEGEG